MQLAEAEAKRIGAGAKAAKPAFPKAPVDRVAALCTPIADQRGVQTRVVAMAETPMIAEAKAARWRPQ